MARCIPRNLELRLIVMAFAATPSSVWIKVTLLALGGSLCLVPAASAQSVWGLDGVTSTVIEHTGPGDPVCSYPTGPVLAAFPSPVPFPCPTATAAGPPGLVTIGDIAVDKRTDTVWVTDGVIATQYTASSTPLSLVPTGTPLTSYTPLLPFGLPLTGLAWDAGLGALWMTDGFFVWAEAPPLPPGCGALGTVIVPPFPIPTISGSLITDLDWDPISGSLFVSEAAGFVSNWLPGGFPGPFGPTPAVAACGLAGALQGVAVDIVDSTALGMPVLYVTDGFTLAHIDVTGAPAPPSFHAPFPCVPTAGPLLGLAYAERALPFGKGADSTGLPGPFMQTSGQSLSPNTAFTTAMVGSVPGSVAGLYLSTSGFNCPPILVLGGLLPVYPFPLGASIVATAPVDAFGNAALATSIPAGIPPGTGIWLQWVVVTPTPSIQVSDGLSIVIGLP